jgi:hypothetical protein
MRGPASSWRQEARAVMVGVVRGLLDLGKLDNNAALLDAIDDAYPFGERKRLPYKMWLLERKLFRDACHAPRAPTHDDAAACAVARDMLGDALTPGRPAAEVTAWLDEQAPTRLVRECLACGASPDLPCLDMSLPIEFIGTTAAELVVPHETRITGHLDAGPLFSSEAR